MSLHIRGVVGTNSEEAAADTSRSELRLGPVFSPSLGRAKAWVNECTGWIEEVHPAGTTALRRTSSTGAGARAAGSRGEGEIGGPQESRILGGRPGCHGREPPRASGRPSPVGTSALQTE